MSKPSFTETMQIGIVVRDLDAKVKAYESYGIGPWTYYDMNLGEAEQMMEHGKPVTRSFRNATAKIGGVMWELVQPLDDEGIAAQWLAEKGEGVYHIGVLAPDYKEVMARHETLPLHCTVMGIEVAYIPTQDELGVILEVFDPVAFNNA